MATGPTFEDMLADLVDEYCTNTDDYYPALAEIVQALETKAAALKDEIADNAEDESEYDPENDDVPKDM